MENKNKTHIVKDFKEKSILVSREFKTTLKNIWKGFTDSEILDQWWGPSPWHAETKSMNFTVGGFWLYAMVGPEGEKHWGRMNYSEIDLHKSFNIEDVFCDENGKVNPELPASKGQILFTETKNGVHVDFKMMYPTKDDLQKLVEMGFEEGITIGMDQLDSFINQNKF